MENICNSSLSRKLVGSVIFSHVEKGLLLYNKPRSHKRNFTWQHPWHLFMSNMGNVLKAFKSNQYWPLKNSMLQYILLFQVLKILIRQGSVPHKQEVIKVIQKSLWHFLSANHIWQEKFIFSSQENLMAVDFTACILNQ